MAKATLRKTVVEVTLVLNAKEASYLKNLVGGQGVTDESNAIYVALRDMAE